MEPTLPELHAELADLIEEFDRTIAEILRDGSTEPRMIDFLDKRDGITACMRDLYRAASNHPAPDPVNPDPDGDRKADR